MYFDFDINTTWSEYRTMAREALSMSLAASEKNPESELDEPYIGVEVVMNALAEIADDINTAPEEMEEYISSTLYAISVNVGEMENMGDVESYYEGNVCFDMVYEQKTEAERYIRELSEALERGRVPYSWSQYY